MTALAGRRPRTERLVGAAFACLRAATDVATETGADLGSALDRAMAAVSPSDDQGVTAPTASR